MKLLESNEWKIIKQINIISKNSYAVDIAIGQIIYERDINDEYKYNDGSDDHRITKLINYPKQNCFPTDEIDEIILNSIRDKYPNSFITNYQIIFDSDSERILHFINRPKEEAYLEIRPDFSKIDLNTLYGQEIEIFRKKINIYQDFTLDSIKNQYFVGYCDYSRHKNIFNKLDTIKFY
ncbi:Uncharacterised protein [Chryseobacterium nakagawai]|uniref:Uncharacterized protein n=1 Tax=Chryseobacterium nakagawai TaxID=1241982 RepID=A0AAD0YM23_CHRNA|nr:hypothetical protein [Chryseobacterium nakagawai]AZA92981.1 hypothetical protein EG343_21460 [Chryseobacterium nakagawai]VEH19608.1 Uncharacterised protein [Chryseobacterium nakagawai]